MRKQMKIFSVLLAAVIAVNAIGIPARAEDNLAETVYVDGVEFNVGLDDNFNVVVSGESSNSEAIMVLDSNGNATVELDNQSEVETYELEVEELNSKDVDVTVLDEKGALVNEYSSIEDLAEDEYNGQVSIAIGAGAVITVGMLLDALIAAALAVIVAGVLYIVATKFYDSVIAASKTKQEKAKRLYYPAYLWGTKVAVAPKGIAKSKAVARIKKGESVYSFTSSLARAVISEAGYSYAPTGSTGEINAKRKKGGVYLYHYHKKSHDSAHSFYGKPIIG